MLAFRLSFRNFVEGGQRLNMNIRKDYGEVMYRPIVLCILPNELPFLHPLNETLLHNYFYMNGTCYIHLYTITCKPINIQ